MGFKKKGPELVDGFTEQKILSRAEELCLYLSVCVREGVREKVLGVLDHTHTHIFPHMHANAAILPSSTRGLCGAAEQQGQCAGGAHKTTTKKQNTPF